MTDDDRLAIAENMRLRLGAIRHQKHDTLRKLRELEIQEEELANTFRRAFPGSAFEPPAANWEDLTDGERVMAHFIARRGHIRRIRDLLGIYAIDTGEFLTEAAFHIRLSQLRQKGALQRGHHGWSVSPELLEVARNPPVKPLPRRKGVARGLERLNERMATTPPKARRPAWRRSADDGSQGVD